jgi:hypothetical protein
MQCKRAVASSSIICQTPLTETCHLSLSGIFVHTHYDSYAAQADHSAPAHHPHHATAAQLLATTSSSPRPRASPSSPPPRTVLDI